MGKLSNGGPGPGPGAFGEWETPVHGASDLLLYLLNGVTTVRNLAGTPFNLHMKRQLAAGDLPVLVDGSSTVR